jgi:Aspartate/ornithine carbamoyltransferase, carbamoyl-P binding domain
MLLAFLNKAGSMLSLFSTIITIRYHNSTITHYKQNTFYHKRQSEKRSLLQENDNLYCNKFIMLVLLNLLTDFISTRQLNRDSIQRILDASKNMKTLVESKGTSDLLKGKILANMFLEPSTRTRSSFHSGKEKKKEKRKKKERKKGKRKKKEKREKKHQQEP